MEERRTEPRTDVQAPAVMTPLAAVSTRVKGEVVNVSPHGVKVRVEKLTNTQPRIGDVYRILSGRDLMLCEVRNWRLQTDGGDIGFKILHWSDSDELKRAAKA